jgi:YcxB-like protein
MNLNYKLQEDDFLQLHLFSASKNPLVKKQRIKLVFYIIVAFTILGYCFYRVDSGSFYFFLIFAFLLLFTHIFYYDKKKYVSFYKKNIKLNFQNRLGLNYNFTIDEKHIIISDPNSETKINYSSIDLMEEIGEYFFLKVITGERLIIPKRAIENQTEFDDFISKIKNENNIKIEKELDWKWK